MDLENLDSHKLFLPRSDAMTYLVKRGITGAGTKWHMAGGPGYQGIVCECCYNSCAIKELKQYCAHIPSGKKRDRQGEARRIGGGSLSPDELSLDERSQLQAYNGVAGKEWENEKERIWKKWNVRDLSMIVPEKVVIIARHYQWQCYVTFILRINISFFLRRSVVTWILLKQRHVIRLYYEFYYYGLSKR